MEDQLGLELRPLVDSPLMSSHLVTYPSLPLPTLRSSASYSPLLHLGAVPAPDQHPEMVELGLCACCVCLVLFHLDSSRGAH